MDQVHAAQLRGLEQSQEEIGENEAKFAFWIEGVKEVGGEEWTRRDSCDEKVQAKNRGWIKKRRVPLYNVERGYLLVEERLDWQVASICLFAISLHRSLNMPTTIVPIGDMDDFLSLDSCHLSLDRKCFNWVEFLLV